MKNRIGKNHLIIPDVQAKPGVPNEHMAWVGNYIEDKRPDSIICIGDFGDMPSLNGHSKPGSMELEGKRYKADIESVHVAMAKLLKPFKKIKGYNPQMVLTLGNHENRIKREVQANPKLDGVISAKDLGYEEAGWQVIPFLRVKKIDGIEYVHYFTSGTMGRPVSSAASILRERHCSGVMGHVQYTDLAFHKKSGHFGLMCGTCYLHDEDYLGEQDNHQRRQIVMLHEVHDDGVADPMFVSLEFLKRKYS